MEIEIWQEKLLREIDKTDFKANEKKICAVFRKLCEPFVGYKDCSFEGNSFRMNNKVYTLQVTTDNIIIEYFNDYSRNDTNPIKYKYSLKFKEYSIEYNFQTEEKVDTYSPSGGEINYEEILNKLMRIIVY